MHAYSLCIKWQVLLSLLNYFMLYSYRYEIMSGCWKVEPAERPSFVDIRESLLAMLKDNEVYIEHLFLMAQWCLRIVIRKNCSGLVEGH